jgi:hypothetical protein
MYDEIDAELLEETYLQNNIDRALSLVRDTIAEVNRETAVS